jgi:hypothetical protein
MSNEKFMTQKDRRNEEFAGQTYSIDVPRDYGIEHPEIEALSEQLIAEIEVIEALSARVRAQLSGGFKSGEYALTQVDTSKVRAYVLKLKGAIACAADLLKLAKQTEEDTIRIRKEIREKQEQLDRDEAARRRREEIAAAREYEASLKEREAARSAERAAARSEAAQAARAKEDSERAEKAAQTAQAFNGLKVN